MITFSEVQKEFGLSEKCAWQDAPFEELMQPYMDAEPSRPFVIARLHQGGKTFCVQAIKLIDQLSQNVLSQDVLSSCSQVDFISIESTSFGLLRKNELGSYKRIGKITIPCEVQNYVVGSLLEKSPHVHAARKALIQNYFLYNDKIQARDWLLYTALDFPDDIESINKLLEDRSLNFFHLAKLRELKQAHATSTLVQPIFQREEEPEKKAHVVPSLELQQPVETSPLVRPSFRRKAEPQKKERVGESSFSKISKACMNCLGKLPQKLASLRPKTSLCPSLSGLSSRLTACFRNRFSKPKTKNKQSAKIPLALRLKNGKTPYLSSQPKANPSVKEQARADVPEVEVSRVEELHVGDAKISRLFLSCIGNFCLQVAIGHYVGIPAQFVGMCLVSLFALTRPSLAMYQGPLVRGSALSLLCTLNIIDSLSNMVLDQPQSLA